MREILKRGSIVVKISIYFSWGCAVVFFVLAVLDLIGYRIGEFYASPSFLGVFIFGLFPFVYLPGKDFWCLRKEDFIE